MKIRKFILAIPFIFLSVLFLSCANENTQDNIFDTQSQSQPQPQSEPQLLQSEESDISNNGSPGQLAIIFDYENQSGYASNQFAIWIEDTNGKYIKTLYATKYTAAGGYKDRPDSIFLWVEKSNVSSMNKTEIDTIAGATPKAGTLLFTWDLKDSNGSAVSLGDYKFFVEGSLRWKNRVLYSGVVTIGENPVEAQVNAEFFYEASDEQPALSGDSPENNMISAVTAKYTPPD